MPFVPAFRHKKASIYNAILIADVLLHHLSRWNSAMMVGWRAWIYQCQLYISSGIGWDYITTKFILYTGFAVRSKRLVITYYPFLSAA